jgi:hypothetical protein
MRSGNLATGSRSRGARSVLVAFACAAAAAALFLACSNNGEAPAPANTSASSVEAGVSGANCAASNTGCPCSEVGQTVSCGNVTYKSQRYVTCSMGNRTCEASHTWGACVGNQVVTINSWQQGGLKAASAQSTPVPAMDPCDPSLFQTDSELDSGTFDSSVTLNDSGGLQITGGPLPLSNCTKLIVTPNFPPANAIQITQVSSPPVPDSLQLTATPFPIGCYKAKVLPIWAVDRTDVATINSTGNLVLQFPYAGPLNVTAYLGTLSGTTTINVTVNALDTTQVMNGTTIANSLATTCSSPVDAGAGG